MLSAASDPRVCMTQGQIILTLVRGSTSGSASTLAMSSHSTMPYENTSAYNASRTATYMRLHTISYDTASAERTLVLGCPLFSTTDFP